MRNSIFSETELIRTTEESIRKRLPPGWQLSSRIEFEESWSPPGVKPDAVLKLKDPEGRSALMIVKVNQRSTPARDALVQAKSIRRLILPQLQAETDKETCVNLMVVSPYLGPSARDRLKEEEVSFADLTGNLRLAIKIPAIFIEVEGSNKNPWRENVSLRTLKGRGAGRAVRGFLDYLPPFGIRELAAIIKSPPATISRVADLLEREIIIERSSPRGKVLSVDWERLLRRWAKDYNFIQANNLQTYLEPRGTRAVLEKLREARLKYAITGSFAAARYAPAAEPRLIAFYVEDRELAVGSLGLRPAETGGNVILGTPYDSVVFDRTVSTEGMTYVRVTQVAIDLLTGPGRNPAEAESLIQWMRENLDKWPVQLTTNI